MPSVEIREVTGEEIITEARAVADYAFGASPSKPDLEEHRRRLQFRDLDSKTLVVFEDGQPMATITAHPMRQNVRGKVVPMSGIAAVATHPAARRRGHIRQLFDRIFADARERQQPVSCLYPFRESFYERLGYAAFPSPRYATLDPHQLTPLVRMAKPGRVEIVSIGDGWDQWRAFLVGYQAQVHGFSLRSEQGTRWRQDTNDAWVALAYDDETGTNPTGLMTYKITGYTEDFHADAFYYTSSAAKYQLLDWIGRHVDQVRKAVVKLGPAEYPELWFRDLDAHTASRDEQAWPSPMARIMSVRDLGGINVGDGSLTVRIVDEKCDWNNGSYTFTGEGGTLSVRDGDDAKTTLTIQGLSALVYCGYDPDDIAYRHWGDVDPADRPIMRQMFEPAYPIMHEEF